MVVVAELSKVKFTLADSILGMANGFIIHRFVWSVNVLLVLCSRQNHDFLLKSIPFPFVFKINGSGRPKQRCSVLADSNYFCSFCYICLPIKILLIFLFWLFY